MISNILFSKTKVIPLCSLLIMTCSIGLKAQFGKKPAPPTHEKIFELAKAKKVGDVSMNDDGIIYEVVVNNAAKTVKHKIISLRNLRNAGQLNTDYNTSGINWNQIVHKDPLWRKDSRWKMPSREDLLAVFYSRNLISAGLKQKLKWSGNNRSKVDLLDCWVNINGRKLIRAGFISKEWGGPCGENCSVVGITSPDCSNTILSGTDCVPIQTHYYGPDEFYIKRNANDLAYFVRLVKEEVYEDPSEVNRMKKAETQKYNDRIAVWNTQKAKKIGDIGVTKDGIIYDVKVNADTSVITHKIMAFQNVRDIRGGDQGLMIKSKQWSALLKNETLCKKDKRWRMGFSDDYKIIAKHVDKLNEGLNKQNKQFAVPVDLISCEISFVFYGNQKMERGGFLADEKHGFGQEVYAQVAVRPNQCPGPVKNGYFQYLASNHIYLRYGEFFIGLKLNSTYYAYFIRLVKEEVYNKPR